MSHKNVAKTPSFHNIFSFSNIARGRHMCCTIWYHSYNLKRENFHGGVLLNFTESNTPPEVFFTFFVQLVPNCSKHPILFFEALK